MPQVRIKVLKSKKTTTDVFVVKFTKDEEKTPKIIVK